APGAADDCDRRGDRRARRHVGRGGRVLRARSRLRPREPERRDRAAADRRRRRHGARARARRVPAPLGHGREGHGARLTNDMRRPSGFSLVELLVVVIAIGILAGALLDRVLPLIGRAQRAAFVQVKADLQTALLLEAAERITRGEGPSLQNLADGNPMTLLLAAPANY